jgi:hypothetical protein
MLCIRKPSVINAYIFGEDDEARTYVYNSDSGFFVKTNSGIIIQVLEGDYIIPESITTEIDPRAIAINPKVFEKHYKIVDYTDMEIIKDE